MHQYLLAAATAFFAAVLVDGPRDDEPKRALPSVPPPLADVGESAFQAAGERALPEVAPEDEHGLVNVFHLSDDVVSGSEPHGEDAYRQLQDLGIKTVLSVDGKAPDLELAAKYGLRYVHVPIQYRGITGDEMLKIAKTFRELEGPFYVHCFHGKHRGPAAAAVGRVLLDGVGRDQAIAEMRQWCGTSPSYEGLYRAIATGHLPTEAETRAFDWDFPAAHPMDGFRDAMIQITRASDQIKYLSKRGWKPDQDHPDANARNESERLVTLFERCVTLDETGAKPEDFRGWLDDSLRDSRALRDAVIAFERGEVTAEAVTLPYEALSKSCKACHAEYRD